MFRKILVSLLFFISASTAFSQQIPVGDCGIVYIYDANGARVKRVYFCNNGTDPYPVARVANELMAQKSNATESDDGTSDNVDEISTKNTVAFQSIDALYPNPTSGLFVISFRTAVTDAQIIITDGSGKVVKKTTGSGPKLSFDISPLATGVYYISIQEKGSVITKKIVKQ